MFKQTDNCSKIAKQQGFVKSGSLSYVVLGALFMCGAAVALTQPSAENERPTSSAGQEQLSAAQQKKLELEVLMTGLPAHERIQDFSCAPLVARHALECNYTSFNATVEKHTFTVALPINQPLVKIAYKAKNHNEFDLTFSPDLPHQKRLALLQNIRPAYVE